MYLQLKTLKETIITLERTDNYYETKSIIDNLCKTLSKNKFRNFILIRKCKKAKRRLRQGFLGKLDNSRCEVVKLIYEIEKVINSLEQN